MATAAPEHVELELLDMVKISLNCGASWDAMKGDDTVRFCGHCQRNVYNLSAMTRPEAEALILKSEGRLCKRYYQRPDGRVITKECAPRPVRWKRARRMIALFLACLAVPILVVLWWTLSK